MMTATLTSESADEDGDGYSACGGDCDDADPAVNPAAVEQACTDDTNCDGEITLLPDTDGDGRRLRGQRRQPGGLPGCAR